MSAARPRRKKLAELKEIARVHTRAALEGYDLEGIAREQLVLGTEFDGEYRIFELYLPAERPEEARVISRATVHAVTGAVTVEVLAPKKQET